MSFSISAQESLHLQEPIAFVAPKSSQEGTMKIECSLGGGCMALSFLKRETGGPGGEASYLCSLDCMRETTSMLLCMDKIHTTHHLGQIGTLPKKKG